MTLRQTVLKSKHLSWRLLDNEEYDEIMSKRLWQKVHRQDELWEFV